MTWQVHNYIYEGFLKWWYPQVIHFIEINHPAIGDPPFMGGRSSTVMLAGSFTGWGTELPGDTCVQVDMHSTGRAGCACSTFVLIPCRTSLRNCCLVRHLAGYTLSIYWFGMRYRTEPLRHGIARWIMIDSLPASLHSYIYIYTLKPGQQFFLLTSCCNPLP